MKSACGWARKRSRQAAARSGGSSSGAGSALKKIVHASEQERADVAEARQRWKEDQPALDPARLVFIDETGTSTKMARLALSRSGRPSDNGLTLIYDPVMGCAPRWGVLLGLQQPMLTFSG